jgi:hypothetical protein
MIYARVHDRTVADDYYAAMQQIEPRLDISASASTSSAQRLNAGLPGAQGEETVPITDGERAQLLELTSQLELPDLNLDMRLNIVSQIREVLDHSKTGQTNYALPAPMLAGVGFT